jgi:polyhydroxybutyrate depolymerase
MAFLVVFALAAGVAVAARLAKGGGEKQLRFQRQVRSYRVHVPPSYTGKRPVPLVIVMHGATSKAEWMENDTGFSDKADREGFIVIYPNGSGRSQNGGHFWNSGRLRLPTNADDVGFIRALVEQCEKDYRIDPKRVYATGMSNGGMMAHRLGVELPDVFAAIAPVAGTLNVACPAGAPVPVIMVHGGKDPSVPLESGPPFWLAGVPESVRAWVKRDGCKQKAQRTDSGGVIKERYGGGKQGAEVVLYVVKEAKHAWPRRQPPKGSRDAPAPVNATDLIWDFFAKHPKR